MKKSLVLVSACLAAAAGAALACDDVEKALAAKRAAIQAHAKTASAADLAKEHYLVGVFARDHGAESEARAEFKAAVAADPSHEASHQALGNVRSGGSWVSFDEAMELKGLVQRDGAWILKEEAAILDLPAREKAKRAEEQAKVSKLLKTYGAQEGTARRFAEEALAGVDDQYKLEPLAWGLRSKSADVRTYSAKELGRIGNRRGLRPLVWRALHDPDEGVRSASVAAAKQIGDPNLLAPFVSAMWADNAQVRMNATQAVSGLQIPLGVRYLVYRFEAHGGGAPRCFYSSINQVSFIQDFDVEVAQTAFIADPIVATIQEGLVIDVQVVATSASGIFVEREVAHIALQHLTGATDVKNEQGAWAAWWKKHETEYAVASR